MDVWFLSLGEGVRDWAELFVVFSGITYVKKANVRSLFSPKLGPLPISQMNQQ